MAQPSPSIPAWVHPGLTLVYDGESGAKQNGRYVQAIRVVMVTRVRTASSLAVAAVSQVQTVGAPVGGTIAWMCNASGMCRTRKPGFNAKFWVDPANPAGSVQGPSGEPFTVVGTNVYAVAGKRWNATTMSYQNPSTGWKLLLVFETKTGLVLAYTETNPAEEVHLTFRSMQ